MRKKTETRKRFGRICALVVVGMFVVMTSMSVHADDPFDWTTSGNFGTGAEVLGTLNDDDLRIITSGMQRMVVTSGGQVGIGTPHPTSMLEVRGSGTSPATSALRVNDGTDNCLFFVRDDGNIGIGTVDPICALHVKDPNPTPPFIGTTIAIESTPDSIIPGDDLGKIVFMGPWTASEPSIGAMIRAQASGLFSGTQPNESPTGLLFYTQDANSGVNALIEPRMVIAENGNVGIGTTIPETKLEVVAPFAEGGGTITTSHLRLGKYSDASGPGVIGYYVPAGNSATIEFPAGENELNILGGNVGIGTTSPTERLDVNSRVRVRDLPLDNTLDDIVVADLNGVLHTRDADTLGVDADWYDVGNPGNPPDDINDNIYTYGAVGIGTMNPVSTLDVDGGTISNVYEINSGPGTEQPFRLYGRGVVLFVADCNDQSPSSFFNWYINGEGDAYLKMTLTEEGNLGIGTRTPTETLDVVGNVHASGSFISGSTTTYGDGFITLSTGTNLDIDSGTLFIDNANDRVGIGTTNPVAKLDVEGDYIRFRNPDGPLGLVLDAGLGSVAEIDFYEGGGGPLGKVRYSPDYSALMLETLSTHDIIISPGGWGNVGIGTTSPSSMLDVNGDIEIGSDNAFYFGDPNTDGSWRITRSGNSLVIQRRESGSWVTKLSLT